MSVLQDNKYKKEKNKNVVVTGRIPEDVYDKFLEICKATGFSVSEAIRALVINEVEPKKKVAQQAKPKQEPQPSVAMPQSETRTADPIVKPVVRSEYKSSPPKHNPPSRLNMGKFTTKRWRHEGMLPCPICEEWVSATNFSRHAKQIHESTTQEIFTIHSDKAGLMTDTVKGVSN